MNTLTILVENTKGELKSAKTEHGLSMLIEFGGKKILFDTGSTDVFLDNAKLMNVDLSNLDAVVCSHSHYDHSGGFRFLAETTSVKKLVTGKDFFNPKYAFDSHKYTYLGASFDQKFLFEHSIAHEECELVTPLAKNLYAVGHFKKYYPFETIPSRFFKGEIGAMIQDEFEDEICLVIDKGPSLIMLVGCSHPGILNMTHTVSSHFNKPVSAIYGGSHLVEADIKRIELSIEELSAYGLTKTGFCHCSGTLVNELLAKNSHIQGFTLQTGDSILL